MVSNQDRVMMARVRSAECRPIMNFRRYPTLKSTVKAKKLDNFGYYMMEFTQVQGFYVSLLHDNFFV